MGLIRAPSGPRRVRSLPLALEVVVVLVSLLVLLGCALLAGVHFDDRYRTDHVTGARIALARYVNEGTLYPPLHEDGRYGGTRFMPLPIVAHAALARVTGDYLVSGRVLSYAVTLLLLGLITVLLRRWNCPWPVGLGLLASVAGTPAGLSALMGLRADATALTLQLSAVALVAESSRSRWTVAAGGFAALAWFAKLTAVWAPAAICVWLFMVDRRRLARFLVAYGVSLVILVPAFGAITDGRLYANVIGLSGGGVDGPSSFVHAPYRLLLLLLNEALTVWLLLPIAGVTLWLANCERSWTVYQLSLVLATAVLVVELADRGTGSNQLLDLAVLTALVVGALAGRHSPPQAAGSVVAPLLALALLWGNFSGLATTIAPDVRAGVGDRSSLDARPLRGLATGDTRVLSEDPYVPVSLGQLPVVLDPFMLLRLDRRDPAAVDELVRRIHGRDFDLVVLVEPLTPVEREWWREYHFGPRVVAAIADAYVLKRSVRGYYLYVPARGGSGAR